MSASVFLGGGESIVYQSTVTFTDAQIKALPTTSLPVVPSPGENKLIVPIMGVLAWPNAKVAYGNVDPDGYLVFADPSDNVEIGSYIIGGNYESFFSNLALGVGPTIVSAGPSSVIGDSLVPVPVIDLVGQPLHLFVANAGDFTEGDPANTLRVSVAYFVLDLG